MTVYEDRLTEILELSINSGGHTSMKAGACVMELVSYVAGERWSDHPECVCPVISAFLRSWNDGLPTDADRNRLLKPLITKVIGSKSTPTVETKRAYLAVDWFIRVNTPTWLELAGFADHARSVREIGEIVDSETLTSAEPSLSAARSAARSVAYSAARSAVWSAARLAARLAMYSAVRSAAYSAAYSAAESAGESAVYSVAYSAAESAAYSAAYSAVWSAADSAVWSALQPTVALLQDSALDLIDRMLMVTDSAS